MHTARKPRSAPASAGQVHLCTLLRTCFFTEELQWTVLGSVGLCLGRWDCGVLSLPAAALGLLGVHISLVALSRRRARGRVKPCSAGALLADRRGFLLPRHPLTAAQVLGPANCSTLPPTGA